MTLPADAGSAVGVSLTVTDITDDQQPLTTATVVDAESRPPSRARTGRRRISVASSRLAPWKPPPTRWRLMAWNCGRSVARSSVPAPTRLQWCAVTPPTMCVTQWVRSTGLSSIRCQNWTLQSPSRRSTKAQALEDPCANHPARIAAPGGFVSPARSQDSSLRQLSL